MTDEDTTPTKLEISPAQIAGSALAAVSSAFFASWAGTAGTFIGVAAGSVIATVGAATYTWWLRRTQAAVRRTAAQVRLNALSTNALPRTIASGPLRSRRDETLTDVDARDAAEGRTGEDETDDRPLWRQWDLPWKKVLLTSVAVMFVALASITAFEAVTGRSVASFTGHDDPHGSTLGNAFDSGSTSSTKTDTPETSTPSPTPTPSSEPTPSDAATGGTDTGSTDGNPGSGAVTTTPVPTPTPSVEPTPTPSVDPSAGTGTTP